ncbi:hypothetical protein ACQPZQ_38585 [Pseudonocardia sp. CA-142604]|uniref:hypothetical protein n=1 Tax=Pseudonocardia sp. CA-142604 TaxID=3240024 RepID=UPI003D941C56
MTEPMSEVVGALPTVFDLADHADPAALSHEYNFAVPHRDAVSVLGAEVSATSGAHPCRSPGTID